MRVAVTSSNGKKINTHFGKAKTFYVYDLDEQGITYLEKRESSKYFSKDPMHAFRPEAFDKVIRTIADCQILYTQKIGAVPAAKCRSLGIQVRQAEGDILSVLGL